MSKLPESNRFFDVSDYGRPIATWIVRILTNTHVTSIQLTLAFFVAGVIGIYLVWIEWFYLAAVFLMVKNILDAADGELARAKNHPSQTGRYLDSIFDFLINLGLITVLYVITDVSLVLAIVSFLCLEFQGTIYNYYYLVQRRICNGELTSRIDEFERPVPFDHEDPRIVRVLHLLYLVCYGIYDRMMIELDKNVIRNEPLPGWFMTLVSSMGLGFQILIITLFLLVGMVEFIIPFFVAYTLWGAVIIFARKALIPTS